MKFPFHVTLLTLIVGLLILTGSAIGVASYLNTRHTVEDLSQQILGHAERRIDQQVNQLLFAAMNQCELNGFLIASRRFAQEDYPQFAAHWIKVMQQYRQFTYLGFTLQSTGNGLYVSRRNNNLEVVESHRNASTGKRELKFYAEADYSHGPFRTEPFPGDPKSRPAYLQAQKAGKQVWTETYMLINTQGDPDMPGLTCAIPVQRKGEPLLGVFSVTFDLGKLCGFLKDISIGDDSVPFIVEYKDDLTRRVIAHPDSAILLQTVAGSPGESETRLVEAETVSDPRVRAFLRELHRRHPNLHPRELKSKTEAELRDLAQIRFSHDGIAYRGTYRCLSTDVTPDWLICIVVPESSILERVQAGNRNTFFIVLGVGAVAVLVSLLVALQVARPLRRLAQQTEAIGQFHLAAEPVPHSIVKEVDRLAVAMEDMKTSLRSFRKYVPTELVRKLMQSGVEAVLDGDERRLTIYFSDIANFTNISEGLSPRKLVEHLGEYLQVMSAEVQATGGTVDKYIGDAIMAFWGAPDPHPGHALSACTAAVRNQQTLLRLREKWRGEGKPPFSARIGLNTGEVIVGNIGSAARLNYTVIGDAVNLASRLEGLNKYYGTEILISESTYEEAKEGVVARPLDLVSVKGKTAGVLVYELLGLKGEASKRSEELVDIYSLALTTYRNQDWTRASALFEQALLIQPQDQPAQQMIRRCRDYQGTPPPKGWDGVHRMTGK